MLSRESLRYDAMQDKDLLLSETGASQEPNAGRSSPRWQRVGLGLLLTGIGLAASSAAVGSHSATVANLSAKLGLQAYAGYGYNTAPAAQYGQALPQAAPQEYHSAAYYQATANNAAANYPAAATPAAAYYPAAAAPAAAYYPAAATPAAAYYPAAAEPAAPPAPVGECGSPGDDCSGSQCCKDPGFQCFTKIPTYATCRVECQPGMVEQGDAWDCSPLGQPTAVPEGPGQCAWSGDNCIGLKCCNDANMKCFKKDGGFAGCQFKPKDGWDNTVLGEFRGWHQVYEPAGGEMLGTTLYCIAVKSPNARVDEGQLLQSAAEKQIGIYSCNDQDVFDGAAAPKTAWKSISNTNIFIDVWNRVKETGKFWNNDWTVKADPDCVFFGNRISMHLGKMNVGKFDAVYIKNCDFKFRFQGSLEIFSEKAMESYYKYSGICSDKIGHDGGEDMYMMTCMDAMGVTSVEDDEILYDKYATGEHLVLDDVSSCSTGWTAAFHPFRTVEVWNDCAETAQKAEAAFAGGR